MDYGIYNLTPPTLSNGQQAPMQVDSAGRLLVTTGGGSGTGSNQIQGAAGNGAADNGINPVRVGGISRAVVNPAPVQENQQVSGVYDIYGASRVYLSLPGANGAIGADTSGLWTHLPPSTASTALSGTIAASGGTAAITMTNTTRTEIINPSTAPLWASWGTPAVNGAGSFKIIPDGTYSPPDRASGTLTLLSTAANQTYTVNRFA